jgi:hypothetical protein
MRKIDQYFYFEPTVPLHHYTGIGTLLNLIPKPIDQKQPVLWASHVSYLNDSQEVRHAKEVMRYVSGPANRVFAENSYVWFLNMFDSWLQDTVTASFEMYVFSLSEQRSLLSQWRSYTPHGKGVSITFSTALIREIAHLNHLKIGKCLYTIEDQRDLIESLIESLWVTYTNSDFELDNEATAHAYFDHYAEDILQVLALIKHEAFEEEREWRLISNANAFAPDVKFRQADGALLLIPYTEFKLPVKDNKFDAITLGPTPHRELSLGALQSFAAKSRLTLNVMESEIPFRKW